jgi:protein SCO1/2
MDPEMAAFNDQTPEVRIGEWIDKVRQHPFAGEKLTVLLFEQHAFYEGRSTNEINKIRGYILAAFEGVGLPKDAIPFVIEELQNGHDAYLVAAAAKALRGYKYPSEQVQSYLHRAIINIKGQDDAVCFDNYTPEWPVSNYTSALQEIFKTFQWLGGYAKNSLDALLEYDEDRFREFTPAVKKEIRLAIEFIRNDRQKLNDCCESLIGDSLFCSNKMNEKHFPPDENVILEDQEGERVNFTAFFKGKPAIIVFFYTRCDNPNKCSLTINKLAELQQYIIAEKMEGKIRLAGITYDTDYDLPFRLKSYGQHRSIVFSADNRFFRVLSGYRQLRDWFDLGVTYSGSLVNRHRTEFFLLDSNAKISYSYPRLQWNNEDIIKVIKTHLNKEGRVRRSVISRGFRLISQSFFNVLIPLVVAFFPKCPLCWAAYLSMLGITGLNFFQFSPAIKIILLGIMCLNLFLIYARAKKRNFFVPLYFTALGITAIVANLKVESTILLYAGLVTIIVGSLLNAVPRSRFEQKTAISNVNWL